jgi:hypothetical protein
MPNAARRPFSAYPLITRPIATHTFSRRARQQMQPETFAGICRDLSFFDRFCRESELLNHRLVSYALI